MAGLWARLFGRRNDGAVERAVEEEHMSPEERRFVDESAEDRQADEESKAHLGGIDPDRFLGE